MGVISKVVGMIDDPGKYNQYLRILGQKHVFYEADAELFQQVAFMFLATIKPLLEQEVRIPGAEYVISPIWKLP